MFWRFFFFLGDYLEHNKRKLLALLAACTLIGWLIGWIYPASITAKIKIALLPISHNSLSEEQKDYKYVLDSDFFWENIVNKHELNLAFFRLDEQTQTTEKYAPSAFPFSLQINPNTPPFQGYISTTPTLLFAQAENEQTQGFPCVRLQAHGTYLCLKDKENSKESTYIFSYENPSVLAKKIKSNFAFWAEKKFVDIRYRGENSTEAAYMLQLVLDELTHFINLSNQQQQMEQFEQRIMRLQLQLENIHYRLAETQRRRNGAAVQADLELLRSTILKNIERAQLSKNDYIVLEQMRILPTTHPTWIYTLLLYFLGAGVLAFQHQRQYKFHSPQILKHCRFVDELYVSLLHNPQEGVHFMPTFSKEDRALLFTKLFFLSKEKNTKTIVFHFFAPGQVSLLVLSLAARQWRSEQRNILLMDCSGQQSEEEFVHFSKKKPSLNDYLMIEQLAPQEIVMPIYSHLDVVNTKYFDHELLTPKINQFLEWAETCYDLVLILTDTKDRWILEKSLDVVFVQAQKTPTWDFFRYWRKVNKIRPHNWVSAYIQQTRG